MENYEFITSHVLNAVATGYSMNCFSEHKIMNSILTSSHSRLQFLAIKFLYSGVKSSRALKDLNYAQFSNKVLRQMVRHLPKIISQILQ